MRKLFPLIRLCAFAIAISQGFVCAAENESGISEKIAGAVVPFAERGEIAGAVMAVADGDRIIAIVPVGWANIAAKKPMKDDSMFWIASQSKPITAALMMMLVDEGKVSLDDPVEKYLPEFEGQMVAAEKDENHILLRKPKHPITIRNILSHTSGLPFKSPVEQPTLDLYPLNMRARSYAMMPLDFEPDSKYQYSNAGINTAGRIVEVVSGMTFEKFLVERLARSLGMKDTTFRPNEEQVSRLASSYRKASDGRGLAERKIDQLHYPLDDRNSRFPVPAGGLFSTAHDMIRFYQMLLNGGTLGGRRYLSAESIKQMTSRQTSPNISNSYGLGFKVGRSYFGHGGSYGTDTRALTDRGLILVWLIQHSSYPGNGEKAKDAFINAATAD